MSSAAPATPTAEATTDATFWDALPTGHRVALFATPFAMLGGLGPWTRGILMEFSVTSRGFDTVTKYGYEGSGWAIAIPAALALLALLLVRDRQKRSARVLAAMGFASLVAVAQLFAGGMLFDFRPWEAVELQWGLPLAALACVVAAGGALWGSRDPNQKPTY